MTRLDKLSLGLTLVLLVMGVTGLAAQTPGSAAASSIGGLRAYWHVFIAYAIVILVVLGWVISIGRRLKDVQERIGK